MTMAAGRSQPSRAAVSRAVEAGRSRLLGLQNKSGYWQAGQPTQVEITAEYLLFRYVAGLWDGGIADATARWLRAQQHPAGGWPARDGGPPDRNASVLAYCALRLAGDSRDAYRMAMAAGWIRDAGGLAAPDLSVLVWLALLGEADWHELRIPAPETIYLPQARSARVAGAAAWGRPTVVPLTVLGAFRPVRRLPFGLSELRVPVPGLSGPPARPVRPGGLDRPPHGGPARSAALRRCAAWILAGQRPDGSWCADGPGWMYSLLALHLLGISFADPALASGLTALDTTAVWERAPSGPLRRLDLGSRAVQSTADAVLALSDAGLRAGHEALVAAGGWLLEHELRARTRWLAGQRDPTNSAGMTADGIGAAAGDTASAITALRRVAPAEGADRRQAVAGSIRWLASVQGRDGGWSRDGGSRSPASARLTGEVLAGLAAAGQPGSAAMRRAAVCLLRQQLPDGSWPDHERTGLAGVDPSADRLDATCAAVAGLVAAGVLPTKPQVRRAVTWLSNAQNPDGGWRSAAAGPQAPPSSDPLATGRALLALLAAGAGEAADATSQGSAWLTRAQLEDGSWSDAHPGRAPDSGMISSTPIRALARYLSVTAGSSVPAARQAQDAPTPVVARDRFGVGDDLG
jgi:squalene-hopene/tetraprenyl-beta-curcumene cyclase